MSPQLNLPRGRTCVTMAPLPAASLCLACAASCAAASPPRPVLPAEPQTPATSEGLGRRHLPSGSASVFLTHALSCSLPLETVAVPSPSWFSPEHSLMPRACPVWESKVRGHHGQAQSAWSGLGGEARGSRRRGLAASAPAPPRGTPHPAKQVRCWRRPLNTLVSRQGRAEPACAGAWERGQRGQPRGAPPRHLELLLQCLWADLTTDGLRATGKWGPGKSHRLPLEGHPPWCKAMDVSPPQRRTVTAHHMTPCVSVRARLLPEECSPALTPTRRFDLRSIPVTERMSGVGNDQKDGPVHATHWPFDGEVRARNEHSQKTGDQEIGVSPHWAEGLSVLRQTVVLCCGWQSTFPAPHPCPVALRTT